MKNLQQIMQMGQELQAKMAEMENTLAEREVSATSGGGMVTAAGGRIRTAARTAVGGLLVVLTVLTLQREWI